MVGTDCASIILNEYLTDTSSMLMQYVTYISPISHTERNNELPIKSCRFILCTLIFRWSIQTTDTVGSLMHMSSTCRKGRGGGVTRKRPLGQVGKCENPLDIYSQTSTNVHLSRLTATLCRGTVQTMTLVLTSLQRQRPQKRVRNNQNHISTTASFSTTDEKLKNGHEI